MGGGYQEALGLVERESGETGTPGKKTTVNLTMCISQQDNKLVANCQRTRSAPICSRE